MSGTCRFLVLLLAIPASVGSAAELRVPADVPSIQQAIDDALPGDVVVVECGVYQERLTLKSEVTVRSITGEADCVSIDAEGNGRAAYAVEVDATTRLEGLTFINGSTPSHGAGLYAYKSDLEIIRCVFKNNSAGNWGGGLAFQGESSPRIEDCQFLANDASYGGGAYYERGETTFLRCRFAGNRAWYNGGGVEVWSALADVTFRECVFSTNHTLFNHGGGASCNASSPRFDRCTFWGNTATTGSALHCWQGARPTLDRCILAFGQGGGSVSCLGSAKPKLVCCIVFGNDGGDWTPCIRDQGGVARNRWVDPLFCDALAGDLSIQTNSPAAESDPSGCGLIGAFGVACGPVTIETTTWGRIKSFHR